MSQNTNRVRAVEACRVFNETFPIGTVVTFEGKPAKTWSHAGIGFKGEASVFLEEFEEPVPIDRLDVPGWERTKRKKCQETLR